ncbi:MAG: glycosyltransferase [Chloroflexota bacterium]|nr:glycosyltransferase [Chloroflexota bacterium]
MRILFTCSAALGHLHPLVPIARAAAQAGHEVAFATQAPFAPTVERTGFRVFPAGMAKATADAFPEAATLRGPDIGAFVLAHVRPAQAAAMAADLLNIVAEWRPDLLVRESHEYGACIVAERLGLPYAVVEIIAGGMSQERRAILSAGLAGVLAAHGLPPDPELRIEERQLVLSPFPPSYRGGAARVADTPWLSIRPTPFDQSGDEQQPAWIEELAAQPTAYLTLGTSLLFNARPAIFRAFIEGLANERLNLIVAVGPNNDPADFGPAPPNVRIERYIPQTLLFSRCAVVICHGGSGTVMAALAHGLPLVLVPIGADQPQNARRCADLELARVLDEDTLDPAVARAAVLQVLGTPSYRQHAEQLRAEIDALPGPEQAVTLLERLASGEDLALSHR